MLRSLVCTLYLGTLWIIEQSCGQHPLYAPLSFLSFFSCRHGGAGGVVARAAAFHGCSVGALHRSALFR